MKQKTKRILTMVLAVLLVLAMLAGVILPALADEMEDLEGEKERLEQEAADAEAIANATEEELAAAQEKIDKVSKEIDGINTKLSEVGDRLVVLNRQIADNEQLLANTQAELENAQQDMKLYYQALKSRIQMMYENDRVTYLEILLNAGSLSDFFSRFEYISEMVEYDNKIMEGLNECKEKIEDAKATIEQTHAQLEADKQEQVERQNELQGYLDQKTAQYASLKDDELALQLLREQQRAEQAAIEERIAEVQGEIENLEYQRELAARAAAEAAARRQQQQQQQQESSKQEESSEEESSEPEESSEESSEENSEESSEESSDEESSEPEESSEEESSEPDEDSEDSEDEDSDDEDSEPSGGDPADLPDDDYTSSYYDDAADRYMPSLEAWSTWPGIGSGELAWPCNSTLATDLYGYRIHPIYGDERFHNGLDLGASYGSGIYACASGEVIICEYYGGYGNLVVIDHGDGMTTWYAHMSEFRCAVGDYVETGDLIGLIGSTGDSTGPHLHLEVHIGGASYDPEWFL